MEQTEQKEMLACLKMKEELLAYKFGNKLSLKTFEAEGLDVSDMKRVVIAVFSPTGSGKTEFIGTAERVLLGADKQTAFGSGNGVEGGVVLEEFLSGLNINLLDTRGLFDIDSDETASECLNIMTGKIRESEAIVRNYDDDELGEAADLSARSMAKFGDQVHAVIFLIRAQDRRLKAGEFLVTMKKIRDLIHSRFGDGNPITVITHEDQIRSYEDRELAFQNASAATGSPIDRTFFITNYTREKNDYSLKTEKQVLEILNTALLSAERFVKMQKLRDVHNGVGLDNESAIRQFFKHLQFKYGWLNSDKVTAIIEQLEENDITTVELLKASWDDVKKAVKMTIGIKQGVEMAFRDIK